MLKENIIWIIILSFFIGYDLSLIINNRNSFLKFLAFIAILFCGLSIFLRLKLMNIF